MVTESPLGALLSARRFIGVPQPLKLFKTEEQKKKYRGGPSPHENTCGPRPPAPDRFTVCRIVTPEDCGRSGPPGREPAAEEQLQDRAFLDYFLCGIPSLDPFRHNHPSATCLDEGSGPSAGTCTLGPLMPRPGSDDV